MFRCYWTLPLLLLCGSCQGRDRADHAQSGSRGPLRGVQGARRAALFPGDRGRARLLLQLLRGPDAGSGSVPPALRWQRRKIYAIRRTIVWATEGPVTALASAAPPERLAPELSPGARLVRDCLDGDTAAIRIQRCSDAIAS